MSRRLALLALLALGLVQLARADDDPRRDRASTLAADIGLEQRQTDAAGPPAGTARLWLAAAKGELIPKDAPTVAVTFPTPNATVSTQLTPTIVLQATTTDPDEPLGGVAFFICPASGSSCAIPATIILGPVVSTSPYEIAWVPPLPQIYTPGPRSTPYLIWANAYNTLGQSQNSSVVPFTLLQPASYPRINLVVPDAAFEELTLQFVTPAAPVLYATAFPDANTVPPSSIVEVEFFDGSNVIGTVTAPNAVPTGYAFVWSNAAPGAHMISARAVDSLGDWSDSTAVPVYIVGPDGSPQVTLTAPTSGALFTASSVVPLAATATSSQGAIERVEFTAGAVLIGSALSPPFTASWANPPPGHFTITAHAYDDLGFAAASPAAYIDVLTAPRTPVVVVTAPAPATTVATNVPLTLAATALAPDGSIGHVDFYAGTTLIGSATTAPYSATWLNPTAGPFLLTAQAYDLQGHSGISAPVAVTVVNSQPPVVSLTSPATGAAFAAPATVTLAAAASATTGASIAKVDFLANGAVVGTRNAAPYSIVWTAASAGNYSLAARATDNLGAVGTSSAIGISVANDSPPSVTLSAPGSGQTFYVGQPIPFSATASSTGGTISKVEFLADGAVFGAVAAAPYAFTWNGATAGTHAVSARATDNLGLAATSATATITVAANNPPSVSLTVPTNGQAFAAGQPVVLAATATDSDGTVAKVEFLADGAVIGTLTATPYTQSWSGATIGTHTLAARATDNHGAVMTSAAITITVTPGNTPTVALVLPQSNQTFTAGATINLAATAADAGGTLVRVDFYAGTTLIGSASSAPYSYAWTNVPAGSYALTAKAIDNQAATQISSGVSIQVISPALTITTPTASASVAAEFVLVSGTYNAPPNSGVTVNGAIAQNDGLGNYFVNNLPLAAGQNTLTVTLTTADGQTLTLTRTVTSTALARMQIYANPDADFAPASFTIKVANRTANTIANVSYSNLGSGQLDTSTANQTTLGTITYASPGLYMPAFVVTDSAGNTYIQTLGILARDSAALDQLLQALWGGITASLSSGNTAAALTFMSGNAQAKYGPVLSALAPWMTSIVSTFSPIAATQMGDSMAEYALKRISGGVTRIYLVYFVQDSAGIWRIDSM